MIDCRYDDAVGIIRTVGTGRWTEADVDAHFRRYGHLLVNLRRAGLLIRNLSDVTRAEVQSAEIEARILQHSAKLHRPGDRIATVLKTNLLKVHVRASGASKDIELFCSHAAAEMWLSAYDLKATA